MNSAHAPATHFHRDAKDLPEDLRQRISSLNVVRVIVRDHARPANFLRLRGIAARNNVSIEEAVARVRALRDEDD